MTSGRTVQTAPRPPAATAATVRTPTHALVERRPVPPTARVLLPGRGWLASALSVPPLPPLRRLRRTNAVGGQRATAVPPPPLATVAGARTARRALWAPPAAQPLAAASHGTG